MGLFQGNSFKVDKAINADIPVCKADADVSNLSQICIQVYVENAVAPLTGEVEIYGSAIGGGGFDKYVLLTKIPIDKLGTNSFLTTLAPGQAAVKSLWIAYKTNASGAGTLKTVTVCGKQN